MRDNYAIVLLFAAAWRMTPASDGDDSACRVLPDTATSTLTYATA